MHEGGSRRERLLTRVCVPEKSVTTTIVEELRASGCLVGLALRSLACRAPALEHLAVR